MYGIVKGQRKNSNWNVNGYICHYKRYKFKGVTSYSHIIYKNMSASVYQKLNLKIFPVQNPISIISNAPPPTIKKT